MEPEQRIVVSMPLDEIWDERGRSLQLAAEPWVCRRSLRFCHRKPSSSSSRMVGVLRAGFASMTASPSGRPRSRSGLFRRMRRSSILETIPVSIAMSRRNGGVPSVSRRSFCSSAITDERGRGLTRRCSRTVGSVAALPLPPAAERQYRYPDAMKRVLLMIAFVSASASADAAETWSGTWLFGRSGNPAGELRTIDRGGDVAFQLSLWGGPPARNSGVAQGHMVVREGRAAFETEEFGGKCRIDFTFTAKSVVVTQSVGDWAACGFGHNIFADGTFNRVNRKVPRFKKL
jgi:hypothetical protein